MKRSWSRSYCAIPDHLAHYTPEDVAPYNLNELHAAGRLFKSRFDRAYDRDSRLRRVVFCHQRYPSRVRILGNDGNASHIDMPINPILSVSTSSDPCRASSPVPAQEKPRFYKCDFCIYQNDNSNIMRNHLKQMNHYCSSSYISDSTSPRDSEDCGNSSLILSVPRAVVNASYSIMNSTSQVICPKCFLPFVDPFVCAYHHSINHNKQSKYTIANVAKRLNLGPFTRSKAHEKSCPQCSKLLQNEKSKTLISHWNAFPDCCPLRDVFALMSSNKGRSVVYIGCSECSMKSYKVCLASNPKSLLSLVVTFYNEHVISKHKQGKVWLLLLQWDSQSQSMTMPPLSERNLCSTVSYCLRQADHLKKHLSSFLLISKKSLIKRLKEEKKMLKSCLDK